MPGIGGYRNVWSPANEGDLSAPRRTANTREPADRPTDPAINLLTLSFRGAIEREYRARHVIETLPAARAGLLLGVTLYALFGILDLRVAPTHWAVLWAIRFAFVIPVMLACFAFTYSPRYPRHREGVLALSMVTAVAGIMMMIAAIPPPASDQYYAGLLLTVIAYCTLLRLRFVTAAALAVTQLATYLWLDIDVLHVSPIVVVSNTFFLASAMILGLAATYALERHARHEFVQRGIITARTRELVKRNEELARKNVELAQSREEVVRASRRTALVFSALTDALPGTVLDEKYRLGERIGSGSFGTVYRGTHLLLQQEVAVKVFRPRHVEEDGPDALSRLRAEGVAACRLRHPNAVAVLDFGVAADSIAYLVMELLHGRSLAEEMRASGPMPPVRCASILEPVCAVLAEAHAQGLVHRDIKPGNIFLHEGVAGEVVKVIDFGIAKLLGDTDPLFDTTTQAGMLIGTPAYIAPERLEGAPYDGAVDVYALGTLLYEMLSGRLPFEVNDWVQAVRRLVSEPVPLRHLTAGLGLPPAMDGVIRRALARDPRARPSAAEMGEVLAGVRSEAREEHLVS